MMPRRRAGLAIVAICLTSLVTLVAAQGPDLPDCALRCVTISATASCNIDSYACVCRTLSGPVRSCITSICSGNEGLTARDQFDLQCENVGFPIDGGTTHTPDSPAPNPTSTTKPPANTNTDTTTDPTPPNTGTRTPNDPADTAGTTTHSSTDVTPTGSSGAPTVSNPSNTTPSNGAVDPNNEDSDGGGSSIGSLIGAIIGGLIGGLLVVALVWFILRRRRRQLLEDDDGVVAYGVPRSDDMSYLNEPKRDSSQPILMGQMSSSSHKYSASGSGFSPITNSPSPHSSPAPVGFVRGPGSTVDSEGTYAARPFIMNENDQQYNPRKGDPPRVLVYPTGTSSVAPESVTGSSSRSGGGAGQADPASPIRGFDDSASMALSSASAQELTAEQLNLVQTMVNRGLPGAAVVDVIQRMLVDNQAVPPEYRPDAGGTLPPPLTPGLGPPPPITPGLPPPPLTPAPPASTGSGSSTQLPYRQPRS